MSFQLKNLLGVKAAANPAPASAAAAGGPAWGGAAAPSQGSGKSAAAGAASLRDIMQQENSQRQQEEAEGNVVGIVPARAVAPTSNAPRKPLSWAAKAGSSGAFPAAAAPVPGPVRVLPKPAATAPVAVAPVAAAAPKPSAKPATAASNNSSKDKEKSSFGGKEMSKDMADWCAGQMRKLNNTDDITLLQFCMSLESAVEVRQYLSEYLGSTPAVSE